MSSYNVKPVSQMMSHDTHYHNNTTYYNNSDNSTPPNIKINNNDDDLPPLTMDTDYNPSPVSVGPPVTPISGKQDELDEMVQQGIRLHEQGQLEQATHMFRVAAEKGNPLGMFLFGVSMRHGWVSVTYLSIPLVAITILL
jgi:hypothetical protein